MDNHNRLLAFMKRLAWNAYEIRRGGINRDNLFKELRDFDSGVMRSFLAQPSKNNMLSGAGDYFFRPPSIWHCSVYEDANFRASLFGMSNVGGTIPLHDHPGQYAYMKVIQGSVKVTTFSTIGDMGNGQLLVKYEGERVIKSGDEQHCSILEPNFANVHQVIALEPETYFFDVFLPGLCDCYYYAHPSYQPNIGEEVYLQRTRCPTSFRTKNISYPHFADLL